MKILDVCCGPEMMYRGFNLIPKKNNELITMDRRRGVYPYKGKYAKRRPETVKPLVIADMRYLPFKDGSINGIIIDPPHFKFGKTSFMFTKYGSWDNTETINTIKTANFEFARVLSQDGFLFLKTMPDRKNIYLEKLQSFQFILPIQMKKTDVKEAALWLIAYKKVIV